MTLYLYKIGTTEPSLIIEQAASYTADEVITAGGGICSPLADGYELSSQPDCSETLRAKWQTEHPSQEQRVEELELLMATLLFGGESV